MIQMMFRCLLSSADCFQTVGFRNVVQVSTIRCAAPGSASWEIAIDVSLQSSYSSLYNRSYKVFDYCPSLLFGAPI
jgi:hypothetical protein